MNKFKLIIFVFIFIILFCIIGSFFVQASSEIKGEIDSLYLQNKITKDISIYGYTFDNPKVIVNPYGENYNTALIMFETDDYVSVKVDVNDVNSYNTGKTNRHYIGVYNLIEGINNITLTYGKIEEKIEIKIEKSDSNIDLDNSVVLSNNHLLVPTGKYIDDGLYTGIREIDIFGKIYYEYLLADGYSGIACEIDEERLAVLNDKLIIIDRQNGNIISSFDISEYKNNWINMEFINDKLILYSDSGNISVDINGKISNYIGDYNKQELSGDVNYINVNAVRFGDNLSTEKSDEDIWLLSYESKLDYDIKLEKEFNRLAITSDDIEGCNNYLILDQLFDRRVYKLCNGVNYIYTSDFDGKYSVYYKVNDVIYKTDKFIKF